MPGISTTREAVADSVEETLLLFGAIQTSGLALVVILIRALSVSPWLEGKMSLSLMQLLVEVGVLWQHHSCINWLTQNGAPGGNSPLAESTLLACGFADMRDEDFVGKIFRPHVRSTRLA